MRAGLIACMVHAFVLFAGVARGEPATPLEPPPPPPPSAPPTPLPTSTTPPSELVARTLLDRPHTIAERELGFIALPNAPISNNQKGGKVPFLGTISKGDATLQTGLHLLYRGAPDWAFGAGALFAPFPTSDSNAGGLGPLPRTHARSYLTLGAEGRYVPLHLKWLEGWVGLTMGGVVIADRFTTDVGDAVPPILGTKQVTVRTEGFAVGVQAGLSWMFAERWVAGAAFRADRWVLPDSPQCTPIGDCATVTGSV